MAKKKITQPNDYDGIEEESRGNYRSTYQSLVDDPDFQALPPEQRHVMHVLKVTRVANYAGIYLVDDGELVTIAKQVGIDQSELLTAFDGLEAGHWLYYMPPLLWVRNALRFEPSISLRNRNHRRSMARHLCSLEASPLVVAFCRYYGFDVPPGYTGDITKDGSSLDIKYPPDWTAPTPASSGKATPKKKAAPKKKAKPKPPGPDTCAEIIRYLNQQAKKKKGLDEAGDEHCGFIRGRWADGHRLADFRAVIDAKVSHWMGTDQEMYLQPSTLFSKKHFGEYLSQSATRGRKKRPRATTGEGESSVAAVE
jgi:uncharacterized phage protein (TIGR02220 family)